MNNNETLNQAQAVQSLKSTEVIRNDYVRGQFISVYNAIWKEGGEAAYRTRGHVLQQPTPRQRTPACMHRHVRLLCLHRPCRARAHARTGFAVIVLPPSP